MKNELVMFSIPGYKKKNTLPKSIIPYYPNTLKFLKIHPNANQSISKINYQQVLKENILNLEM